MNNHFLILGSSNTLLARKRLVQELPSAEIRTLGDVNSVFFLDALFSSYSATEWTTCSHLCLEIFPNDVLTAVNHEKTIEYVGKRWELLAKNLELAGFRGDILLLDIWPRILKHSFELIKASCTLSELRLDSLKAVYGNGEVQNYDLGLESNAYDHDVDPFCLNESGYDEYCNVLHSFLAVSGNNNSTLHERLNTYSTACKDKHYPILSWHVTNILPPHLYSGLSTYESSLVNEPVLPLADGFSMCFHVDASESSYLIGVAYIASLSTRFITIKTDNVCIFFESSTNTKKSIKKIVTLPSNLIRIEHGISVEISVSRYPILGAQEISVNDIRDKASNCPDDCNIDYLNCPSLSSLVFSSRVVLKGCIVSGGVNSGHASTIAYVNEVPREVRVFSTGFWDGYKASEHPVFQGLPGLIIRDELDIHNAHFVLASVFCPQFDLNKQYAQLRSITSKPILLFTNEHSANGLPGLGQINPNYYYYATLSHYFWPYPSNVWVPMAVNWFGWDCCRFFSAAYQSSVVRSSFEMRVNKAVFCYTNQDGVYRNQLASRLDLDGLLHSCGNHLNNNDGVCAPRGFNEYVDYCSNYRYYLALENAKSVGYHTEKVLWGVMAGCHTFYWGDPTASLYYDSSILTDLSSLSPIQARQVIVEKLTLSPQISHECLSPISTHFRERVADSKYKLASLIRSALCDEPAPSD